MPAGGRGMIAQLPGSPAYGGRCVRGSDRRRRRPPARLLCGKRMAPDSNLEAARAAFARREWTAAAHAFAAADAARALGPADLDMAGLSRHLIGDDDAALAIL